VPEASVAALLAAALLAGCGNGPGQVIAPPPPVTFGPAVTLAQDPSAATAPAAAIDASGVAVVLWSQTGVAAGAMQPNAYVVARENLSGAWAARHIVEPAEAIDTAGDRIEHLQALAPTTGVGAAWLRKPTPPSPNDDRVRAAWRTAADVWEFGNVAAGVSGLRRSGLVFAANDAGHQALAWIEPVNGVPQVQLRVRRVGAGGSGWTAPVLPVQTNRGAVADDLALAMDPVGRAMIVWRQTAGVAAPGELRSRTFDIPSAVFSPELTLQDAPLLDQRAPRVVALAGNRYLAVWEQASGETYDLRTREGNASNWQGVGSFTLDQRTELVSGAQLIPGPLETALVAWQQHDRLYFSRFAIGVWSVPIEIGAGLAGQATDLRLAGAGDRAYAVWIQRQGTASDLYAATIWTDGPRVAPPILLESEPASVAAPSLAMNAGGAAVVAWLQHVSGQTQPEVIARIVR